jgi:NAD(P)-dependent dehydrogenase (short-subunit alcohol dehydrogenase family)
MGKLTGKVALIAGGNSGIGLATAKRFVQEGAQVFISGRTQSKLNEAVKQVGSNVTGVQGEVAKLEDLGRLFEQIKREKGTLDIVLPTQASPNTRHSEPLMKNCSTPYLIAM